MNMQYREFERCTPESVGIPSRAVLALIDKLECGGFTEMHGLMIMRHDKVCAEGWWAPYAPRLHHALHSLSKTWTSTAVGLAEYAGLLHVSDRVCKILPEYMPDPIPERISRITIRDLLTMSSGSETEKGDYAPDWVKDFFKRPFEHEPGTFWRYNTHGTAILSAIVEKVTGKSMIEWLNERLFCVIGVDPSHVMCRRGGDGTCLGGHGMFTSTEDNLRLMRLYLHGGEWDGVRLLSKKFAEDAVSPCMDTAPAHAHTPWIRDNACGYGYQIWRCTPDGAYRADGAYGQFVIVVPKLDLMIAINEAAYIGQNMSHNDLRLLKHQNIDPLDHPVHGPQATLEAVYECLLPAIDPDIHELQPSAEAARLAERMQRLAVPRPFANRTVRSHEPIRLTLEPEEGKMSFAMLQGMEKHNHDEYGAEAIELSTDCDTLTIAWAERGVPRSVKADMRGGWSLEKLDYTDQGDIVSDVACSAAWTGENQLELSMLWYETENHNRYVFSFEGAYVRLHKWTESGMPDPLAVRDAVYRRVK